MFGVTILGCNSAIAAFDRHPTAQVVTLNENSFLIDCGEGTQMQMSKYKIRRSKINHIFISHLHGDHYFGLIGLLTSMGLTGREEDLHIYSPVPLKEIIDVQLNAADTILPYNVFFHPLVESGVIIDNNKYSVECFNVHHRVECWGFIIREKKRPRKIAKEKVLAYQIPSAFYERLQCGDDYITKSGEVIANELLTTPNTPPLSYAFCGDTIYKESIAEKVKNVSLLYHEATYLDSMQEKAFQRYHSTSTQAATIAKLSNSKRLLIGHFSSKYEVLDDFLIEAERIFPCTELAQEGVTFLVK